MPEKNKKQLKAIIISNLMVLGLSFVLLATMSFAWFFSAWSVNTNQTMNITNFIVNLSDKPATPSTELIKIENAYPCTFEQAQKNVNNIYSFSVANTGNVAAQFRLSLQVISDTGYNKTTPTSSRLLSEQIRFATKIYSEQEKTTAGAGWTEPAWTEPTTTVGGTPTVGGFLFNKTDGATLDFKQYFNKQLLKVDSSGTPATDGKEYGKIYSPTATDKNNKVYIKILVWLDENATLESTKPIAPNTIPELHFKLIMSALQLDGGAKFTPTELATQESEKIPKAGV